MHLSLILLFSMTEFFHRKRERERDSRKGEVDQERGIGCKRETHAFMIIFLIKKVHKMHDIKA